MRKNLKDTEFSMDNRKNSPYLPLYDAYFSNNCKTSAYFKRRGLLFRALPEFLHLILKKALKERVETIVKTGRKTKIPTINPTT